MDYSFIDNELKKKIETTSFVAFFVAHPGDGNIFSGDYLEVARNWNHTDENKPTIQMMVNPLLQVASERMGFEDKMTKDFLDGIVENQNKYFEILAQLTLEAARDSDKVVLTFAANSKSVRDFYRKCLVGGGAKDVSTIFVGCDLEPRAESVCEASHPKHAAMEAARRRQFPKRKRQRPIWHEMAVLDPKPDPGPMLAAQAAPARKLPPIDSADVDQEQCNENTPLCHRQDKHNLGTTPNTTPDEEQKRMTQELIARLGGGHANPPRVNNDKKNYYDVLGDDDEDNDYVEDLNDGTQGKPDQRLEQLREETEKHGSKTRWLESQLQLLKAQQEEHLTLVKACLYLAPVSALCGGFGAFLATILLIWVLVEVKVRGPEHDPIEETRGKLSKVLNSTRTRMKPVAEIKAVRRLSEASALGSPIEGLGLWE